MCHLRLFFVYSCFQHLLFLFFFFFNDTATTEIYTLSLHDALPIYPHWFTPLFAELDRRGTPYTRLHAERHTFDPGERPDRTRSEEHTSELQSRLHLVCRLLLEKKKEDYNLRAPITT